MSTVLYPLIQDLVDDAYERLNREKISPWNSIGIKDVNITDCRGRPIGPFGEIGFTGTPETIFWNDQFMPICLRNTAKDILAKTAEMCQGNLEPALCLDDAAALLKELVRKVYARMADVDFRKRRLEAQRQPSVFGKPPVMKKTLRAGGTTGAGGTTRKEKPRVIERKEVEPVDVSARIERMDSMIEERLKAAKARLSRKPVAGFASGDKAEAGPSKKERKRRYHREHSRAREIAENKWREKPEATTSWVIQRVSKSLEKEGLNSRTDKTLRGWIQDLNPRFKDKSKPSE